MTGSLSESQFAVFGYQIKEVNLASVATKFREDRETGVVFVITTEFFGKLPGLPKGINSVKPFAVRQ